MIELKQELESELLDYLVQNNLLEKEEEPLSFEKAGEGNMNVVMRLKTVKRSIILKQSREYVQKYPQVAAPIERVEMENAFYKAIDSNDTLRTFSPEVLHFDKANYLLVLSDLGSGKDFLEIYKNPSLYSEKWENALNQYLEELHGIETDFPSNSAMKVLNHEHIFLYPFMEENGFDLDQILPGLQASSLEFKKDVSLKERVQVLGERYLKDGKTLLHGDFYPGSWLLVGQEIKVIDPEFGFKGDAAFDYGVKAAHLLMAGLQVKIPEDSLTRKYAGVEILRRVLGLAQIPLGSSLSERMELCHMASSWLKEG